MTCRSNQREEGITQLHVGMLSLLRDLIRGRVENRNGERDTVIEIETERETKKGERWQNGKRSQPTSGGKIEYESLM